MVAEVLYEGEVNRLEIATDRDVPVAEGYLVVGALGTRYATEELAGDFHAVEEDGLIHVLSGGAAWQDDISLDGGRAAGTGSLSGSRAAGAEAAFVSVDGGLPSTVSAPPTFSGEPPAP